TLPFYKGTHVPWGGVRYPLWYALQHISTAIGLIIVSICILSMRSGQVHSSSRQKFLYWFTVIIIATVITWIRFAVRPLGSDIGNLIVSIISGLLLALVCCGFIKFRRTKIAQASLDG
ncbi:MAG TPA: DUF4184 family protein, partial [Chryseolinea sp.]